MHTTYRARAAAVAVVAAASLLAPSTTTPAVAAAPTSTASATLLAVAGWGSYNEHQSEVPAALARRALVAVSAGEEHSLVLTADGAVAGWGRNDYGQATPPADLRTGVAKATVIDAGDYTGLAVLRDGSVRSWGAAGDADEGQADVPADLRGPGPLTPAVDVAAGTYHSLAITRAGTVRAWGALNRNGSIDRGQTAVPVALRDGSRKVVDIAAGKVHSLAVDSTGQIWAWGDDEQGAVSYPALLDSTVVVAVAAYGASSLALLADGRVVGWGDNGTGIAAVPGQLSGVAAIDLGAQVGAALTRTGQVVTWGDSATAVPRAVAVHAPFRAVAAGGRHTLVLHRMPKAATRVSVTAPAQVAKGTSIAVTVRVSGVVSGTVVLRDRGRVVARMTLARSSATTGVGRVTLRKPAVGKHVLVAAYAGSALALPSTSPSRTVVVKR